ncbi:subtype B tannase [Thiofilum flexile]|uniref:subtype B tannase n=1 Tax=Thiofilum flexile TaxID=125627 RepID=UPI00036DC614|nr:subtype B tannase [Thiofilum flexile]
MYLKHSLTLLAAILSSSITCTYAETLPETYSLDFDPNHYKIKTFKVQGQSIQVRAFEHIVYVTQPVDVQYQHMHVYVPEAYFTGKTIGSYNITTAPIFFPNRVGGYMPGEADTPKVEREGNATLLALSKGYVVAAPAARGRTNQDAEGGYIGKAPAAIVDLKAAVRYLRYNDKAMPGDAEKIIANGTSAGGALATLLGATGNNSDYVPYLTALGAANVRDDIFAVSAYCPITNLDQADAAYEWQFNGLHDYKKLVIAKGTDYQIKRKLVAGTLTPEQIKVSERLKPIFTAYLNSLHLKDANGQTLSLDEQGNGSFKDSIKTYVMRSAQQAIDQGKNLSTLKWLTINNKKVMDLDFNHYLAYMGRMKTPPAFDGLDLSSGENELFGTDAINAQHFTAFGKDHSTVESSLADPLLVKMMNPLYYLGIPDTKTAHYWRIRHGTLDKDTSLAIPVILATLLQNKGYQVDFALPWERPHSGDYDLEELFSWVEHISQGATP